jgi:hypothetical protein
MKPEKTGPLCKVLSVKTAPVYPHCRRARSTWFLECGHRLFRKGSVPVPAKAHCNQCTTDFRVLSQRKCRVCGCTDADYFGCIERTGKPCHWIEADLCSACEGKA